jgi:hypothetical protein
MTYLWNMVTGDIVATSDGHLIDGLLADGYIYISRKQYLEIIAARKG